MKSKEKTEYFELKVNPRIQMRLQRLQNQDHGYHPVAFVLAFDLLERFINDAGEIVLEVAGRMGPS